MPIIYLLCILLVSSLCTNFTLHKHSPDSPAKCLDGSPAALYYLQGSEQDKFVIYFEGGGLCRGDGPAETIEYCYRRSFTDLGSSQRYPSSRGFEGWGFLSSDPHSNPFHNWTKVFIPYCDGSTHQGSKLVPVSYKDRELYFRGSNNTLAHFEFLDEQFNFWSASEITITGTSAGGIASYVWSNYVYDHAHSQDGVLIIPDSGTMLINFPNYFNNKTMLDYARTIHELAFTDTKMPLTECVQKYPDQDDCAQSGNLYEFIRPKMFIIQSEYDEWGLTQILQLRCLTGGRPASLSNCNDTERAYIEKYRQGINEAMSNFSKVETVGIWSVSCVQHGFLEPVNPPFTDRNTYRVPTGTGVTIVEALELFRKGQKRLFIDEVDWPMNTGCSGLTSWPNLRMQ